LHTKRPLQISIGQFFNLAIAWGMVCWIISIHYFSLWAIIAAPLLWLAGNALRAQFCTVAK
jgi:hypothetical protein